MLSSTSSSASASASAQQHQLTPSAFARDGLATSTAWKGFLFSCAGTCSGDLLTLPIDVVKTRMQLQGELGAQRLYRNSFHAASTMVKEEGPTSLWRGLAPALLRQATYGTLRYGSYEPIKQAMGRDADGGFSLWKKVLAGTLSGAFSAALCNPTDLVKIRMQAERVGKGGHGRYRGVADAFSTIARTEGFTALYRGVGPTTGRAALGNAVEMSTYDEMKAAIVRSGITGGDNVGAHLTASLAAGFVATIINSPFDVVKSRVMNQPVGPDGKGKYYSGMIDCFAKSVKTEGVMSLWKGFWPNYARIGPRVVTIFLVIEQLRARFD